MKIDGHFSKPIDLRYVGTVRRRPAAESVRYYFSGLYWSLLTPVPTYRLEMEVEAGRDHMAVVVEAFIFDVLVSRFNFF